MKTSKLLLGALSLSHAACIFVFDQVSENAGGQAAGGAAAGGSTTQAGGSGGGPGAGGGPGCRGLVLESEFGLAPGIVGCTTIDHVAALPDAAVYSACGYIVTVSLDGTGSEVSGDLQGKQLRAVDAVDRDNVYVVSQDPTAPFYLFKGGMLNELSYNGEPPKDANWADVGIAPQQAPSPPRVLALDRTLSPKIFEPGGSVQGGQRWDTADIVGEGAWLSTLGGDPLEVAFSANLNNAGWVVRGKLGSPLDAVELSSSQLPVGRVAQAKDGRVYFLAGAPEQLWVLEAGSQLTSVAFPVAPLNASGFVGHVVFDPKRDLLFVTTAVEEAVTVAVCSDTCGCVASTELSCGWIGGIDVVHSMNADDDGAVLVACDGAIKRLVVQ